MKRNTLASIILTMVMTGVVFCTLAAAFSAGSNTAVAERTVELTYRFTVRGLSSNTSRSQVLAWVPIPPTNESQRLEDFRVDGPWSVTTLLEPEYGNRFLQLNLSGVLSQASEDLTVSLTFRVNRRAYRAAETEAAFPAIPKETLARFLAPDSLVPINGRIATEAYQVAGTLRDPLARARRLYEHIVDTVTYDKSGKGWGRGDALFACDLRAGNCTDFHSLFIGEARSLGIPARFVMGVPLPEQATEGPIAGYHCWAEFYVEGKGWIPVDASEASKFPYKKDLLFGGLDENRVQFTIGRDIRLPGSNSAPLNYVIYPHVEVNGRPYDQVETRFSFKEI